LKGYIAYVIPHIFPRGDGSPSIPPGSMPMVPPAGEWRAENVVF